MQVHGFFTVLAEVIHAAVSTCPSARPDACGASASCVRVQPGLNLQDFHKQCRAAIRARPSVGRAALPPPWRWPASASTAASATTSTTTKRGGRRRPFKRPPGTLGISFGSDDTSNVIIAVRPTSPLAGSVAVGDKLISISGPGRAPFRCGGSTGSEVVGELRAAENTATASSRLKSRRRLRSRHHPGPWDSSSRATARA